MSTRNKKFSASNKDTPASLVHTAATGDLPCLLPVAKGQRVHWFCPLQKTTGSYASHSSEFAEAIREPCALGLADRIRRELKHFDAHNPDHGWDTVITNLEAEGIL
jgi:hypothetical protein